MKKNENKKLIEDMEFNSYEFANQTFSESNAKLNRIKIGLIISAVATASMFIGIISSNTLPNAIADILFYIAVIGSIVSYIVGGGIKIALRALKKLMFLGWVAIPLPYSLATGIFTLILAPICFLCIPIVFVLINYVQVKRNYKNAECYMNLFRPSDAV